MIIHLENIFMDHDLYFNILVIFGIKENRVKNIVLFFMPKITRILIKFSPATYDWFCGPGFKITAST